MTPFYFSISYFADGGSEVSTVLGWKDLSTNYND